MPDDSAAAAIAAISASLDQVCALSGRTRPAVYSDWLTYSTAVFRTPLMADAIRDARETGRPYLAAVDMSDDFIYSNDAFPVCEIYGDNGGQDLFIVFGHFRTAFEDAVRTLSTPINGQSFVAANDLDLYGLLYQHFAFPDEPLHLTGYAHCLNVATAGIPDGAALVFATLGKAVNRMKEEADGVDALMARAFIETSLREYLSDPQASDRIIVEHVVPIIREHMRPIIIHDSSCGSGVSALASSQRFPGFAVETALVKFTGMDIDPICVQMARLNEIIYGLNGFFTASVNGDPLPKSMFGNAVHTYRALPRNIHPVQFFDLIEEAEAYGHDPAHLRRLSVQARLMLRRFPTMVSVEYIEDHSGDGR